MSKTNTNPPPTYPKPPAPPAPPPTKIIKEGCGEYFCKVCSSSVKHSFLGTYLGGVQPLCINYYQKTTRVPNMVNVRDYIPKIKHFVSFIDFEKSIAKELRDLFNNIEINEYNVIDYSDGDYFYIIDLNINENIANNEDEDELIIDYEVKFTNAIRQYLPKEVITENKFAIKVVN